MMISVIAAGALTLSSMNNLAEQNCSMELNYNIRVAESHAALYDQEQEIWRVDADGRIYIRQEAQPLNVNTQPLAARYHEGVRTQTYAVIEVINEAVEIADYALTTVFTEMFGEKSKATARVDDITHALKEELAQVGHEQDNVYHLNGSELDAFDARFSERLEQEMELIMADSMGSVFMMLGRAMLSGSGSFEERMAQFETRMEAMGAQIEQQVDERTAHLDAKTDAMCEQLNELAEIERQLAQSYPIFSEYSLFVPVTEATAKAQL